MLQIRGRRTRLADKEVKMRLDLTPDQASEMEWLLKQTLGDMSHEIAATDNARYRAQLVDRRNSLRAVADELHARHDGPEASTTESASVDNTGPDRAPQRVWTVEVIFTEDADRTRADARLRGGEAEWHGWGRARRNPVDPDVPMIGEELATARALSDLSHQLLDQAAHKIERFEGHPVHLYG
jgi:Rv2632c-like